MSSKSKDAISSWYQKNRSLVLRQTPFWVQSFAFLLVSLGSLATLIAFFTKIDEVITVQGKLESSEGRREIESPVGGKVDKFFVKDGEFVKKGQLIMRFDTKEAVSEKSSYMQSIALEEQSLKNSQMLYKKKRELVEQKLRTVNQIVQSLETLVDQGGYQKVQYLRQLDQKFQLETELNSLSIEEDARTIASEKAINNLKLRLKKSQLLINNQNVLSPISGIAFQPQVGTDGVIEAGRKIMSIIPQKGLKASVWVSNKDIGLVSTELPVRVRVDAFPYTKYGELTGQVTKIGADVVPPDNEVRSYRFPVEIILNKSYLTFNDRVIPLRSGLSIQANLKLREKRVISLLSDLLVTQSDSVKSIRQQ